MTLEKTRKRWEFARWVFILCALGIAAPSEKYPIRYLFAAVLVILYGVVTIIQAVRIKKVGLGGLFIAEKSEAMTAAVLVLCVSVIPAVLLFIAYLKLV